MVSGWTFGGEYFAGHLTEKALSVDNLFVFLIVMTGFAVPRKYQQKVLMVGIIIALILRAFINGGQPLLWVPEIPIWFSLLFIAATILVATVASLAKTRGGVGEAADGHAAADARGNTNAGAGEDEDFTAGIPR